jgi:hypothetical protein
VGEGAATAEPDSRPSRQLVVEGQAGTNLPLGQYGLAVDGDVRPWLSVSGGVGIYVSHWVDPTPRYALMPRVRFAPWGGLTAVSGGAGISYGKRAPWGDASSRFDGEVAVERRWVGGLRLRALGGIGYLPSGGDSPVGLGGPDKVSFYAGVGLGYSVLPNPQVTPEQSLSYRGWYGWQSLSLDAAAGLIPWTTDAGWLNLTHESGGPDQLGRVHISTRAGAALFLISGPLVHVAHRRYGRALVSVGLRAVLAGIGATLGAQVSRGDTNGGDRAVVPGMVMGAAAAAILDAAWLGWD